MARIAELTSHLQLADSKSVHFHAEVSMQAVSILKTLNPFLNFPQASALTVSLNVWNIMLHKNLFLEYVFWLWSSMHKNGYCRKLLWLGFFGFFFLSKSFGSLVLGVLSSTVSIMYRFVHIC